ncbi:uncharacterized protein LOC107270192 isoform X2 [Cephus cinctus]|nr:uncharacterized protein LOC107270192 isoform X2 [Cephus cinctus]
MSPIGDTAIRKGRNFCRLERRSIDMIRSKALLLNQKFVVLQFSIRDLRYFSGINGVSSYPFINNRKIQQYPAFSAKSHLNFSIFYNLQAQTKAMSGEGDKKALIVDYNDLLEAQKDNSVLIIDVREQDEINKTGKLPGSIHIPMADVSNLLSSLSEDAFKEKFGKAKPAKDTKIILSCHAGRRSAKVQEEIQKLGYESAYNYVGGWMDWESKQKV